MSKNIEEIVESVLPFHKMQTESHKTACDLLKQALAEKKLCVPLSEEEIREVITFEAGLGASWTFSCLAKAIHKAQFDRGEK